MACPETVSGPCYIHDGIHTCRGSEGGSIFNLRHISNRQKARVFWLFRHSALEIIINIELS